MSRPMSVATVNLRPPSWPVAWKCDILVVSCNEGDGRNDAKPWSRRAYISCTTENSDKYVIIDSKILVNVDLLLSFPPPRMDMRPFMMSTSDGLKYEIWICGSNCMVAPCMAADGSATPSQSLRHTLVPSRLLLANFHTSTRLSEKDMLAPMAPLAILSQRFSRHKSSSEHRSGSGMSTRYTSWPSSIVPGNMICGGHTLTVPLRLSENKPPMSMKLSSAKVKILWRMPHAVVHASDSPS
mmetsp:Transcript_5848/g.13446  ORF Transcript_5848/g.13446 Transcript_5848/m.13446 type:complete len:240 (-) Transcript_5848:1201-1920(-)